MLHIAVCDDEKEICEYMEIVLERISRTFSIKIEVEVFYSGEKLCQALYDSMYFDMIFLDIELITMNGVQVGRIIREQMANETTHIVFISGKDSYAMELFNIRPLSFLIKPLKYEKIHEVFSTAIRLIQKYNEVFEFQNKRSYYRIPIKNILYFQSNGKKIIIIMADEAKEFYSRLSIIEKQLKGAPFIPIHKSYLVNYAHVVEAQYDKLRMSNNDVLSISQQNRKMVRNMLLKMRQQEVKNDV